jgi:diguanylate cyclase (GGDEF)-like protein
MSAPVPARSRDPERRVWQLAGLMAVGAACLAVPMLAADPRAAIPSTGWAVLVPLFALAEVVVIHLPAQRSSHSHTLREIPAVVGLTFLAPQQYLTAYVVGAGLALMLWSHQRGLKLSMNVSMFSLETALGLTTYHLVLGGGDPIAPPAWLAALCAVLVTDLVSAAAVTLAISLTEGAFDGEVLREALRSGIPAAMVNTCVALLCATLLVARPSALALLGVVVVLLVLGYRVYMGLARGYAQLQLLYRFVGTAGRTAELDEVVPTVLAEAAELLHATRAQLVSLVPGSARVRVSTWEDGVLSADTMDPDLASRAWWAPARSGEVVLQTHAPEIRQHPPVLEVRDGIAVPLREDDEVVAVLTVCDRTFEEESFNREDVRVFETLAAHTAVALDKARVVDRLRRLVTEREHDALHDALTGLPNRRAFHEAVEAAMSRHESGAVLLLGVDDFRDVNDTLGHSAGDGLLSVTGERLRTLAPGMVARLGGDEFAILLPGADTGAAVETARSLQQAVTRPVPLLGVELAAASSVGVATFRSASCSAEELLGNADVAMVAAKRARTGVEVYRTQDGISTARRLVLAADLPGALARGELDLFFQPQARSGSGDVAGFEALLRWSHPTYGWVPPPEIVAVAQRTGLLRALTDRVVTGALAARQEWRRAGHDLTVSVNVTPDDIVDPTLAGRVRDALADTGVPAASLVLEIVESDALGDPEKALEVMEALAELGVELSIDDFGTGYSSLAYLDRLPVDEVKIDQSFVFRLEKAAGDATIVRATVALAHELGLRVVAEGVESELATRLVTDMGCDLLQGFGLARPMPAADVVGWLGRRRAHLTGPVAVVRPLPTHDRVSGRSASAG